MYYVRTDVRTYIQSDLIWIYSHAQLHVHGCYIFFHFAWEYVYCALETTNLCTIETDVSVMKWTLTDVKANILEANEKRLKNGITIPELDIKNYLVISRTLLTIKTFSKRKQWYAKTSRVDFRGKNVTWFAIFAKFASTKSHEGRIFFRTRVDLRTRTSTLASRSKRWCDILFLFFLFNPADPRGIT